MIKVIKICGMREAENIRSVASTGVTWMGMIFWERSARFVSDISAADAIPEGIKRVGVFVNQPQGEIADIARRCRLDIVQLHGDETAEYIKTLRPALPEGCRIMKAVSIADCCDINAAKDYGNVADFLLFDTKCKSYGGSGKQFDWTILQHYDGNLPFLLSGGLGIEDAEQIKNFRHPRLLGIDLNSKFETAPAIKDAARIASFINTLKTN